MSNTELIKTLNGAISALRHGRQSTARKKVALVDAELNPNTTQIVFTNTTELVEFIDGLDGCGLITTDLDAVAAGIHARCFPIIVTPPPTRNPHERSATGRSQRSPGQFADKKSAE